MTAARSTNIRLSTERTTTVNQEPAIAQPAVMHPTPLARLRARSLGLAFGLTAASLLWLDLSSRMTAAGHRIADLDATRSQLVEARISALLRHAAATDSRRIEARARALGFQPVSGEQHLAVSDARALPRADAGQPEQALTIARRAAAAPVAVGSPPDLGGMLVEFGAAAPASAAEINGGVEATR